MELATGMGLPPLAGNEERLSFILKKCQAGCWRIFNETDKEGCSALDAACGFGTVFTGFTNAFAFCPEFGGGERSWDYAFL